MGTLGTFLIPIAQAGTKRRFKLKYGIFILSVLVLAGCSSAPKPVPAPLGSVSQSGITDDARYRRFLTTYTVQISAGRQLLVTVKSNPWLAGESNKVSFSDELLQGDGKRVLFDCENIADKIIDAALVQEIAPICPVIHNRGIAFWKSLNYRPTEFTDTEGIRWQQVK